jgi:phosphate uptake regulator
MELRKVQISGGSSYVVSLPKSWIQEQNLGKNDMLGIIRQADGTLLLTPDLKYDTITREKEFSLKKYPDPDTLLRSLIGAYISGYTLIRITSPGKIPADLKQAARQFAKMTIGQEIAEETENSILLKDVLNTAELPFENTLRRMFTLVKGMHEDTMEALAKGKHELAADVISRDTEVDRLYWLIHRQFLLTVSIPSLARKMEIEPAKAAAYYQISRIIERVGDHAVSIAAAVQVLISLKADEDIITKITGMGKISLNIFTRSVKAMYTHSIDEADAIISATGALEQDYHTFSMEILKMPAQEAVPMTIIANSMCRISEYSSDIAEVLINHMVGSGEK